MVKNKKMSKTSIAVIVLALLLVFSLVMGMTGAWFTDQKTPEDAVEVNFGTIAISATASNFGVYRDSTILGEGVDAMPGDHIKVNLTVAKAANTDEDFYYVVKIVATVDGNNVGTNANAWKGATASTAFESSDAAPSLDFELDGTVYDNDYQGDPIVVSYEVRAIQKANLTAAQAWTALTSGEYAAAENYDFA